AAVRPGVGLPRLAAELARMRDRIELPPWLAAAHIEGLDHAGNAFFADRAIGHSTADPDADHHHVAANLRDARPPVDCRLGTEARTQIHTASFAERRHWFAGPEIQRDEIFTADCVKTTLAAVGPVGEAACAVSTQSLAGLVG